MKQLSFGVNGIFRARVINNKDPLAICRIQVRVPCIHGIDEVDGIPDESLPYAMPCTLFSSYDAGTYLVPEVGSTVFVLFENNDPKKPVYIGQSISNELDDEEQYHGYPDSDMYKTSDGLRMKRAGLKDTPTNLYHKHTIRKHILFKSPKGSSIEFNDNDDNESITLYDRLGQAFSMYAPVSSKENEMGIYNRGLLSMLKMKGTQLIERVAIIILKSLSGSFLRFVGKPDYTQNDFITVYKDDKAGISINIGTDDRMLVFYKDTKIELTKDDIKIKTKSIKIESESISVDCNNFNLGSNSFNVKSGSIGLNGQVITPSPIDLGSTSTNIDSVTIKDYEDNKDEEVIQE